MHPTPSPRRDLVGTCRGNERELPADNRYEDVERAELARGVSDEAVDVPGRSHVSCQGKSLDACCTCFRRRLVCALSIDVGDGNGAARRDKRSCDRATDAATPAADYESGFSFEHLAHVTILQTVAGSVRGEAGFRYEESPGGNPTKGTKAAGRVRAGRSDARARGMSAILAPETDSRAIRVRLKRGPRLAPDPGSPGSGGGSRRGRR
jgi:hypothetical protein